MSEEAKYFDKETALDAVREDGMELKYASEELRNDKELVLEALKQIDESDSNSKSPLKYASEELRSDGKFVLEVVKQHGEFSCQYASEELKNDKEFVLEAVKIDSCTLMYASEELKNDKEVVLEAVKEFGGILVIVCEELRNDKEVILEAVKKTGDSLEFASEELKNDKEVVLEAVKEDWYSLKYVSEELKNDKEVVLEAAKQDGISFEYASEELRFDREFVLLLVKQNGTVLIGASEDLRNDREVVLEAAKSNGYSLEYASEELKNDKVVVLEAVRRVGIVLEYSSEKLRNDKEIVLEAVRQIDDSFEFASDRLQKDPDVLHLLELHKKLDHISKAIDEKKFVDRFVEEEISELTTKERQIIYDLYIQRSEIQFEMKRWKYCVFDILVSLLLCKENKEDIWRKLENTLEEVVKNQLSVRLHQNVLSVARNHLWSYMCECPWMEQVGSGKQTFELNEWNESSISGMKNAVVQYFRKKLPEIQSTLFFSEDLLKKSYFEQVRSSILEKYNNEYLTSFQNKVYAHSKKDFENIISTQFVQQVCRKIGDFEDEKREIEKILKDSSLFEEILSKLKGLDLSEKSYPLAIQQYEKVKSVKYFGFVGTTRALYSCLSGFGLIFGLFSGGGLFGLGTKCRRLFYGTFNKDGLRHGEKCTEFSSRDGIYLFE